MTYIDVMTRQKYSLYLDAELIEGIRRLKQKSGVPESETIRRALRAWLQKQGALRRREGRKKAR
jgi:hypothetical protein